MGNEATKRQRPMSGRVKIMYEGIFEKGTRLTAREWSKTLFDDERKIQRVYRTLWSLRMKGYPTVSVKRDPDSNEAGIITPLTDSRNAARTGYRRIKDRIDANLMTYGIYAYEGLSVFPDMQKEVVDMLEDSLTSMVGAKKVMLALEEPTAYATKRIPSHTGPGQQD